MLRVRRAHAARRVLERFVRPQAAERSSGSPGSSARAGPRSREASSASIRWITGSCGSTGGRSRPARRARRFAVGWPTYPRTASSRASSSRCRSATTSRWRCYPTLTPGGVLRPRRERSSRATGSCSNCGSRQRRPRRSCGACPAGTSRRSCWRSGSRPSRGFCSWTSRRTASTSARKQTSTGRSPTSPRPGLTILLISSELPEILGMSDRVLVMREGGSRASSPREEATQERIIQAAAGVKEAACVSGARCVVSRMTLASAAIRLRELGIFAALAATVVFFSIQATNFATVSNWQNIATDVAMVDRRRRRRDHGRPHAQHRPERRLGRRSELHTSRRTRSRSTTAPRSC